ncbi:hypothetical protein ACGFIF_18775 [Kribbella sp. NPDC049174]|uniref:hypothetical protein n=1 Tax=Kribbella sp. NPDC049174 TaxID=3364112 RepID=UPI00371F997D
MGRFQPLLGAAVVGAFIMVAVNVMFALFTGDPGKWVGPAVVMSPFAAIFGAIAGAAVAALTRRPPPRRPDDRRSDKRKYR